MRHSWEKLSEYRSACRKCGLGKLSRPHPYERRWYVEFTRTGCPDCGGGGEYALNKTPQCKGEFPKCGCYALAETISFPHKREKENDESHWKKCLLLCYKRLLSNPLIS